MILNIIRESFLFALHALNANRLRTVLSLLGVTIGIFSIIFVLSVVDSMEAEMKSSFDSIGSDVVFIQKWPFGPEDGEEDYAWWKYMRRRPPALRDMKMLQEKIECADAVAFQSSTSGTSSYLSNSLENTGIMGVTYDYNQTIALNIAEGRYFNEIESEEGKNFAIIGNTVKNQLFGLDSPLGKEIKIGGLKVLVIGVFEKEGTTLFGDGMDGVIMMPFQFATRLIPPQNEDSKIFIKAKSGISNEQLRDEVTGAFREVRRIKPKADKDFSIIESSMINEIVDSIIDVFNVVGMVIGIFSILVGAFSIANIMFVSVAERTPIIGIQKSLGAKNFFILIQYLFESISLCIIGGAVGLLFVWLTTAGLGAIIDFSFILPMQRVIAGITISVAVGVIAGIIPAIKASRLNPVDAIRSV
jgi:putative ABC transport system permease protein